MKKNKFSILKESNPLSDEELWADEIVQKIIALEKNICVSCKKSVDKSSMEIGYREIYEQCGVCPECVEEIFFPKGQKK